MGQIYFFNILFLVLSGVYSVIGEDLEVTCHQNFNAIELVDNYTISFSDGISQIQETEGINLPSNATNHYIQDGFQFNEM